MDKYEVINDALLIREVRGGFESLSFNGLEVSLRDRAGSEYNNFSNKAEVIHTFKGSEHLVGSIILVHHFVKDQVVSVEDESFLLCYPEQIIAKNVKNRYSVKDDRYLEDFVGVNGYLAYPSAVETDSSLKSWGNAKTNHKTNSTNTLSGDEIEYMSNADYEIYHNEQLVFFIKKEHVYAINGMLQTEFFTEVTDNVVVDKRRVLTTESGIRFTLNDNVLGINNDKS